MLGWYCFKEQQQISQSVACSRRGYSLELKVSQLTHYLLRGTHYRTLQVSHAVPLPEKKETVSQPVRSCSIRRGLAFCALSWAEMSYCQIPEMFAGAKGNPELININILHLRNCENQNICINGSDHDFPISTLRNNVHVQHDQIRTSASSLAQSSCMSSLLSEHKWPQDFSSNLVSGRKF